MPLIKYDLNETACQVNAYLLESAKVVMKAAAEKGFYECGIHFKEDLDINPEKDEDRLKILALVEMLYQEGIETIYQFPGELDLLNFDPNRVPTGMTAKWYSK